VILTAVSSRSESNFYNIINNQTTHQEGMQQIDDAKMRVKQAKFARRLMLEKMINSSNSQKQELLKESLNA
jgi:hypothetical protein